MLMAGLRPEEERRGVQIFSPSLLSVLQKRSGDPKFSIGGRTCSFPLSLLVFRILVTDDEDAVLPADGLVRKYG